MEIEVALPTILQICSSDCPELGLIGDFNSRGLAHAGRRRALGEQALTGEAGTPAEVKKVIDQANGWQAEENTEVEQLNNQPCAPKVDANGCRICPRYLLAREVNLFE